MTLRAIVVLLLVLNLGVAAWGLARPSVPADEAPVALDSPRLRLVGEPAAVERQARAAVTSTVATAVSQPGDVREADPAAPVGSPGAVPDEVPPPPVEVPNASAAPATPAPAAAAAATPAVPVATQCAAIGPFVDTAAVATARRALAARDVAGVRIREVTSAPRGWQVRIAAQPDRAAADALAQRIGAAGFNDYLVVPSGAGANGIALGRYRGERAAREREAALRAAGFDPVTEAVGDASTQRWLDFEAPEGFDVEAARRAAAAPASTLRACTVPG